MKNKIKINKKHKVKNGYGNVSGKKERRKDIIVVLDKQNETKE